MGSGGKTRPHASCDVSPSHVWMWPLGTVGGGMIGPDHLRDLFQSQ